MDVFPPSMISLLPQRILLCLVFFLMKINLQLLFLSHSIFSSISFKIQDQTCLQHSNHERLQWHTDGALCSIPLIIIPGLHLLFWQLLALELLFSHSPYNHKALYSDWQQPAPSPFTSCKKPGLYPHMHHSRHL